METSSTGWWMPCAPLPPPPAHGCQWPLHLLPTGRSTLTPDPHPICGVTCQSLPPTPLIPANGPAFVGGIKVVSYGTGTVRMRLKTSTSAYISATLQNVLYVPDLAKQPGGPVHLFSASSAADQSGAEVTTGVNTRITMSNGMIIPGRRAGKHFFIDAIPGFLPDAEEETTFLALAPTASMQ